MKVPLSKLAHTRSGDKGDTANIGVIAWRESDYPVLVREVTAERVKQFFGATVKGDVGAVRVAEPGRAELPVARSTRMVVARCRCVWTLRERH